MEVKLSIYSSIYVPTHTYGDKLIQVANISLVSGLSLREELKSLGEEGLGMLRQPFARAGEDGQGERSPSRLLTPKHRPR